jgi:hypothetical protein
MEEEFSPVVRVESAWAYSGAYGVSEDSIEGCLKPDGLNCSHDASFVHASQNNQKLLAGDTRAHVAAPGSFPSGFRQTFSTRRRLELWPFQNKFFEIREVSESIGSTTSTVVQPRNGLFARSNPMVVVSPWPGNTITSSGSTSNFSRIEPRI